MGLFGELKRRNVFRMGIAYVVVSWLLLQVVDVVAPMLELPDWVPKLILLMLAIGFVPTLIFSWVYELTPEGLKKESELKGEPSASNQTAKKLDILTISLLVVVLALVAVDRLKPVSNEPAPETAVPAQTADAAITEGDVSIAVLPFVNMSADPEQEFFSDGISEELLNVLAQYPGLRVAARTSAFQFKGQNRDIAEIARQLRVNHVLEGSVRKSGERLRITAQLINADSGYHLWSNSWDRELVDIFAIQDEISDAIAMALQEELELTGSDLLAGRQENELPSIPAAASAQAYEYYLKGRQLINGRARAGIEEAVTALERALELDEAYAPAHAQLAIAYALLKEGGGTYGELTLDEVLSRARPHIERAFELNPKLAEAFGAQALLYSSNYEFDSAIESAKKATTLNPSYVDATNWLYLALLNSSRWPEAREVMDHMMAIDPLSIVGRINYSYALARTRDFERARKVADELARQSVRASFAAHGLVSGDYTGEIADSTEWYLKGLALDPGDGFSRRRLSVNLSNIGEFEEARRLAPSSDWWISAVEQNWNAAIPLARERLERNPGDNVVKTHLANVLHMSGDLAAAQVLYEELLTVTGGRAIMDWRNTSIVPTARMAYGRHRAGDTEGAMEIIDLIRADFSSRQEADIDDSYMWSAAAMATAIEGDAEQMLGQLYEALDKGLRDRYILNEPVFDAYCDNPEFQQFADRLDGILEQERRMTLELICFNNPAPDVWQPLPATCEKIPEEVGAKRIRRKGI